MDVIRIAHLSDLHFGAPHSDKVWESLLSFLNETIKPHLVVVTGDIVHWPDLTLFDEARTKLDRIVIDQGSGNQPRYRVCPGNHDRHPWGNALGSLSRPFENLAGYAQAPAWFDAKFSGTVATAGTATDFDLVVGNNRWKTRLLGFDSSIEAKYSAQGFADPLDLGKLFTTTNNTQDFDLVMLLHHHHLLPIRELETTKQKASKLFQPTIMLNAGTVLDFLAERHVNIVLHGHEHHRSFSRYGTLRAHRGEVLVLGAGSATGNDSRAGCSFERASFNLIELSSDRGIYVREVRYNKSHWVLSEDRVLAIDGRTVRRNRFHRCIEVPSGAPCSRLMTCLEFYPDRNIDFTQVRTNWTLEGGRWIHTTTNSSGWPSPARFEIFWPGHEEPQTFEAEPKRYLDKDHTYQYEVQFGGDQTRLAQKIVVRLQWQGGAVLTQEDMGYLSASTRGDFRRSGRELATFRAHDHLEAASLLVRLPPQFAPALKDIEVFLQAPKGDPQNSDSLAQLVHQHAPGVFSIEVPFPRKGYVYGLVWTPSKCPPPSGNALKFRDSAARLSNELLNIFEGVLHRSCAIGSRSIALYLPDSKSMLDRMAQITPANLDEKYHPPGRLSLNGPTTLHRLAWWGRTQAAVAKKGEDNLDQEAGFLPGERAMVVVPIRYPDREEWEPWGLIRVGFHCGREVTDRQLEDALHPRNQKMFTDAIIGVLHKAMELG